MLTRRQFVRGAGSALLLPSAELLLPSRALSFPRGRAPVGLAGGISQGGGGTTFDFYISPTGSDSNAGTSVGAPWTIASLSPYSTGAALTNYGKIAGKRVGLLPGTYGVSSLMSAAWSSQNTNGIALDIPGGSALASTYIGSSSAGGVYSQGTATIEANDNGFYGGSNSIAVSMIGSTSERGGYVTLDGLKLTGASTWCVTFGDIAGTNAGRSGYVMQNCEVTGNNCQSSTVASGKNIALITILSARGAIVTNNYFHDNVGWTDGQHFSCFYQWGLGQGTGGTLFTFNTLVNSGGIQIKENTQWDMEVAYNYIDMSTVTPGGQLTLLAPIWGGCEDGGNGTISGANGTQASFHHNILISYTGSSSISPAELGGTWLDLWYATGAQQYWSYPVAVYNNTCIATSALNGCGVLASSGGASTQGSISFFNNGFYDAGFNAVNQYGWFFTNQNAFALCDYNIYGTNQGASNWANFSANGSQALGTINSTATSFANWKTLTGGDAHSSANSTNPFTNGGTFALQYEVQSGSPWYGTGKIGGVSSGASTNVGAMDGTETPGSSLT